MMEPSEAYIIVALASVILVNGLLIHARIISILTNINKVAVLVVVIVFWST